MGFWSGLGNVLKVAAPVVAAPFTGGGSLATLAAAGGSAIGAAGQAAASNRGSQVDIELQQQDRRQAQQNAYWSQLNQAYQNLLARETTNASARKSALRDLQVGAYLANNTSGYRPKNGLPSYGFGPKASTASEMAAGSALEAEMLKRIQAGDAVAAPTMPTEPTPFTVDPKLRKSSFWEKIANVAGPALTVYGATAGRGSTRDPYGDVMAATR